MVHRDRLLILKLLRVKYLKLRAELYDIIADHSGNPVEKVEKDSDRDYWMTSKEALEYGMIDEVLERTRKK